MAGFFDASPDDLRLVQSASRGGRSDLYNNFLSASPGFAALNPLAQSFVARRFNPLSAQFALNTAQQAASPSPVDFRSYIQGNPLTNIRAAVDSPEIRSLFAGGALTPAQEAARDFLSDEPVASNIITQLLTSSVNPLLRQFAEGAAARRIASFRDADPGTNLLTHLFKGGFGAGI